MRHDQLGRPTLKPKVRLRISELQSEVATKLSADAALSVEQYTTKLRERRDEACQRGQVSAAINAEQLRGKLMGFYVKQIATGDVDDFSRMTDAELDG